MRGVRGSFVAADMQDTRVAPSAGVEGVVEDVAMLHVVYVDDDKLSSERAGGLVLRGAMSAGRRQGETNDENCALSVDI
jgi:hypothetical protein